MRIKYLATYHGPAYFSLGGLDFMEAFTSIQSAKDEMHRRQTMGYSYTTTYNENADGDYVKWEDSARYDFPTTTNEDTMELYGVTESEPGVFVRHNEPSYRLSIGERGGIVKENY